MRKLLLLTVSLLLLHPLQSMAFKDKNTGFTENKGQWPDEVRYLFQSAGINAWITQQGVVYDFHKLSYPDARDENGMLKERAVGEPLPTINMEGHVVRMALDGSATGAMAQTGTAAPHTLNYFLGNEPSKWATDVLTYNEVTLRDVYQGIDIRYYTDRGMLRYDFIVHPGADPSAIVWAIEGVRSHVSEAGQLVFETSLGEVKQAELLAYQMLDGKKTEVASNFVLTGDRASFHIGDFDSNEALIIDPVLYATYLGGSGLGDEWLNAIEVRPNGERIVFGDSPNTANYPTVSGSYSQNNAGLVDIVVSKINSTGSALVYSTFIGGNQDDFGFPGNISHLNSDGSVTFTGTTNSPNFPMVVGAFDNSHNGGFDAVLMKLGPNGNSLSFSTYLGSTTDDYGLSLSVDGSNNLYVVGTTFAGVNDFPITGGAYDQTANGGGDLFVSKFNSTATTLTYSTLIGGNGVDISYAAVLDAQNNLVIAGHTASTDFPTTSGTLSNTYQGGTYDLFVTKLNTTGSALVASTLLGGGDSEQCRGVDIASDGTIVITGNTVSSNFPTMQAHQVAKGAESDIFVSKLNGALTSLVYSTYFGASWNELAYSVRLDVHGTAYITGWSGSNDLETTSDAVQPAINGGGDLILARFSPSGQMLYSTYYGGNGIGGVLTYANEELGSSVQVDNAGTAHMCGRSVTDGFPVTAVNLQATGTVIAEIDNNTTEGILVSLNTCSDDFAMAMISSGAATCVNSTVELMADGGQTYSWSGPNGYSSNQQNPTFTATAQSAGTYTVTVSEYGCTSTAQVTLAVNPALGTSIIGPGNVDPLTPTSYLVSQSIGSSYTWSVSGGAIGSGQGTNQVSITFPNVGQATVTVTETNGNCSETVSLTVNVGCTSFPASPSITGVTTVTPNSSQAYSVQAQSGFSYVWTVSGGNIISGAGTNAINVQWGNPGQGTVSVVIADGNGCEAAPASVNVTIQDNTPPPVQWTTIATDPAGDGANPQLMDGTLLEYRYDAVSDSLWFRATVVSMSTVNTQEVGMNVHLYYSGGGQTFDFWSPDVNNASNNALGWHRMLTTWVTGTPPSNYSGTIGICDLAGFNSENFTNLSSNNISVRIDQSARTITLGLLRAAAIPASALTSPIQVAAAVGAHNGWNDDIYVSGATMDLSPSSIGDGAGTTVRVMAYPNPNTGQFRLDLQGSGFTPKAEVMVMDNTGRIVFRSAANSLQPEVALEDVAGGIYLLRVSEGNLLGTTRIAVVK